MFSTSECFSIDLPFIDKLPFIGKSLDKMSIEELSERVKKKPDDIKARLRLAKLYYEEGKLENSAKHYELAYKSEPDNRSIAENLASVYEMSSISAQSERKFEKAMEYAFKLRGLERRIGSRKFRGEYQVAITLAKTGKKEEALDILRAILDVAPEHSNAMSLSTSILIAEARDYLKAGNQEKALAKLKDLIDLTRDETIRLQIARILIADGQTEKAEGELGILADNPMFLDDSDVQYEMGILYGKIGDYEKQSYHLSRITQDSPLYEESRKILNKNEKITSLATEARSSLKNGEIDKAIYALRSIISLDPRNLSARLMLIKLLAREKKETELVEELDILASFPQEAFNDEALYEIGSLYAEMKLPDKAKVYLKRVSDDSSYYADAQKVMASLERPQPSVEKPSKEQVQKVDEQPIAEKPEDKIEAEPTETKPDERKSEPEQVISEPESTEIKPSVTEEKPPEPVAEAEQEEPINPTELKIRKIIKRHNIEVKIALAMVKQESNMNPYAVSKAGAAGLCQIMPATARELGLKVPKYKNIFKPTVDPKVDERFDSEKSLDAGLRYLSKMVKKYDGNVPLALSAYNAGAGRTKRRVARISETTAYVADIMTHYYRFKSDPREEKKAMKALVRAFEEG